jgi:transposase
VSHPVQRSFSTEYKAGVVQRIEAGERLSAVAEELGIRRKLLYEWRAAYRALGSAGLNRKRGPKACGGKAAGSSPGRASSAALSVPAIAPSSARPGDELVQAKRIAELERVIGRQQVDLDFFREALRLMDATPPSGIATNSTRSSKR